MAEDDLNHSEVQELLGAFALGAVDDQERAIIEAHLETCVSCRAELHDHLRLVETLRRHGTRVSPLASTEANGSHTTNGSDLPPRPGRRWEIPGVLAVMVVMLVAISVQGQLRFHHLDTTTARIELLERAQLAASDPTAVVTELRTPGHDPVLTVVSRGDGGPSYAIDRALPALASHGTYQLWSGDNGAVTAAAALGRHPDVVMFTLPAGVTNFIVTIETSPAPARPTLPAIATGQVSP